MNADNALEHELQRFGAAVASMHSIVDNVMVRVMAQPLTVRRQRRVHKLLVASVAGLAACLAVGITTWVLTHRGKPADTASIASTSGAPRETLPNDTAKAETPKLLPVTPGRSKNDATPLLGFEQCRVNIMPVQESSAIVRVKELALKDDVLEYEVIRVIYGRVDGKVLHVRAGKDDQYVRNELRHRARESKKEVREPSAEEVHAEMVQQNGFKIGRESIIFLRGGPQGTNPAVWPACGGVYGAPFYPLDNFEKDIVEVIKTGAHLRPVGIPSRPGACELLPCIRCSERVVRARLVKIGETSARWQVSGLLYVAPPPGQEPGSAPVGNQPAEVVQAEKLATISVELATWRARAETIVRYRVAQQPGTAVKEEDIQIEVARLLKDELTPGHEAILFILPRGETGGRGGLQAHRNRVR